MLRRSSPIPGRADRARNLAHDYGEHQKQPQPKPSRAGCAGHRGVADRQPEQKQEEGVDANIHAEKSADRKRPPTHVSHCMRGRAAPGIDGLPSLAPAAYHALDARHCRYLSLPSTLRSARDADSSHQRPSARDALQHPCAAARRLPLRRSLRRHRSGWNRSAKPRRGARLVRRERRTGTGVASAESCGVEDPSRLHAGRSRRWRHAATARQS